MEVKTGKSVNKCTVYLLGQERWHSDLLYAMGHYHQCQHLLLSVKKLVYDSLVQIAWIASQIHFFTAWQCLYPFGNQNAKPMEQFGWTVFEHPINNPILAPNDYRLFLELKKCLSGQHLAYDTELITFFNSFLWKTMSEFYICGIYKLTLPCKKCHKRQGNYRKIGNLKYFSKYTFQI